MLLCGLAAGLWVSLSATAQPLPPEVDAALARAKVPRDAVSFLVLDAQNPGAAPRLAHRAQTPMNPASVMKLVTTYAALDLLGPAYLWNTPVYTEGAISNGVLNGNLYIKGQGDPKLVLERLWLLLRRVQGLGIKTIAGDIVLDRSAFNLPEVDPAQFDGEPLRPYNAAPDALLVNFKSVVMTFTPDRAAQVAQVQYDPPLAGVALPATVALGAGDCGDYRAALKADFADPLRIRFAGNYPASCGEKVWPVAYVDPKTYAQRAVLGLWDSLGGKVHGSVRLGTVPAALAAGKPALVASSVPMAEVIRDINKFSNNVMAQQMFLTLGRAAYVSPPTGATAPAELAPGSFDASRAVVQRWWRERLGNEELPVLDNGSGLSRQERITAQALGRMLQSAYVSPVMSELMSSLPISGVDGTLRRVKGSTSAHLKTGSLSNVVARAGYVLAASGKRYVLVAFVNHANANEARPAVDALVEWAGRDQ
ncbi:MAG: D-alanyl-D-alanine carboxypeptidase/D-alanyl-D-alanine-endopeptidase [Rhodoferax sp.]|nr:D-alanyl-D-alanine carboxypeptidase/D-alanyl-D-alanine-endopeptidase [Rhodoferax sp.]MDZ7920896.1 D-alanyl-D-alanine carboxypeptidase/D-alanyl-D-alanine-endopeptidase [Rhodoferax sp.]